MLSDVLIRLLLLQSELLDLVVDRLDLDPLYLLDLQLEILEVVVQDLLNHLACLIVPLVLNFVVP